MDTFSLLLLSLPLLFSLQFFLNLAARRLSRLPPGPAGLPVLGSLHEVGDRPHESLAKLAAAHGPLMTVRLGFVTTVVASTSTAAREILLKHDQAFLGRPIPYTVTAEADYELSMAWLPGGQRWRDLRRLCAGQLFTAQRLDALQGLRGEMVDRMVRRVARAAEEQEAVPVGRVVFGTALSVLSNTMFSGDVVDPKSSEVDALQEAVGRIMDGAGKRSLADVFPVLKPLDPQGLRREVKVAYDRLHALLDETIDRRAKRRAVGSPRNGDFLDVLLDHSVEYGDDKEAHVLTRQDIKVLLTDLFLGGTDTTTTTVEWAMTELIRNPSIMEKTKQELSKSFGSRQLVDERIAMNLPYLQAVLKEAMRVHPTSPLLLPHRAEVNVEIDGYIIPKNTQILVNAWALTRDPDLWTDPTSFVPERFLDSDMDFRGRDCTFIPFGSGRRICPGLTLGIRMLSLLLATLVHNFDWKLPGGMALEEIDVRDTFKLTLQKADPLVVIPVKAK